MTAGSEDTDSFLGAWRVSEYVHTADGAYLGVVRQRRELRRNRDGSTQVWQQCEPDSALADHPMGAFEGEWVFDLRADGSVRHYLGPDVVGRGFEWEPGIMTGRGVWPRFGYSFTSYAALVAPDRQVTGGLFSVAGAPMCAIAGVAESVERLGDAAWPELDIAWTPNELRDRSHGELTFDGRRVEGADGLRGTARFVGPSLIIDGWLDASDQIERLVLADAATESVRAIELRTTHAADGGSSVTYRA
jgi:hypothetical protein